MMWRIPQTHILVVGLCVGLSGCAGISGSVPGVRGASQKALHLDEWLAAHPIPHDQEMAITELGRTDSSSMHVVQIRRREGPHLHKSHDLVVILQRGHGILRLGSKTLVMRPGSVAAIPRGVVHAFVNTSRQPAAALVVFSPPFDDVDTVPVVDVQR